MASARAPSEYDVFDFAAHLHPESVVPEEFRAFNQYVGDKHTDVEACIEWFDDVGVDGAALSQPFFMGHEDRQRTATANDALLSEIADYPQLFGLAAIPVAAGGQAAAAEFERSLDNGYVGGALPTKSDGVELHDRAAEPIVEVADSRGVPLLVHPKLDESLHPAALDDTYRLNAIFGREAALSESIFKVIHDGVLDRYPDLDLVYHHLGGNIAAMMGRIHLQLDEGRWPEQEHVKSFEEFKSQLEERIYLDTSGFFGYRAPLRVSLEEFPTSQLVFGTDAPYEARTREEYRGFVAAVQDVASHSGAEEILSTNAVELLEI